MDRPFWGSGADFKGENALVLVPFLEEIDRNWSNSYGINVVNPMSSTIPKSSPFFLGGDVYHRHGPMAG